MSQVDLNETRGLSMRHLGIPMTIIPTLSIILRIWARAITTARTKFWWDDVLAFCAWACCMCSCAFFFVGADLGLGKHIEAITPLSNISEILKLLYVSQIVFDSGIAFGKFSVLCFYLRIFTTHDRRFKRAFWVTFALVAIFITYKLPTQIFLCVPPRKYWESATPGHCDNDYTNFGLLLAGLLLDVITDFMILILPMPIITGLQMRKGRKVLLFIAFFCGYATWITSIGRMGAFIAVRAKLANPDFTWYQVPELSWSLAEISVSVLSICIPSWFYLIQKGSKGGMSSLFTTKSNDLSPKRPLRGHSQHNVHGGGFTPLHASSSSVRVESNYPPAPRLNDFMTVKEGSTCTFETAQHTEDLEMGVINARYDVTIVNNRSSSI